MEEIMSYSIAIDGPAGAGKSTIAKQIAKEKGYIYVDTGAMYRAVGIFYMDKGVDGFDAASIEKFVDDIDIEIAYSNGVQQVILNGQNVTAKLREEKVGKMASIVSQNPLVRKKLVWLQQQIAKKNDVVMDGRDIGTKVLPDANVKIYLTASSLARATRRYKELVEKGENPDFDRIKQDIEERDKQDMTRKESPLVKAEDAILVDSSEMTIKQVVDEIINLCR